MHFTYDKDMHAIGMRQQDLVNVKQMKMRVIRISQKNTAHRSETELRLIVDYFIHFNIFKHIYQYNDLFRLAQQIEYRFCRANQILFRQEEEPEGFYVLVKGELAGGYQKSEVLTNFFFDDMEVLLKVKSGTGFGELAILENKKRAITIRSIRDSYLLFLSKSIYTTLACPSLFKSISVNIKFLKPLETFQNFTDEKLREFCVASLERPYPINHIISAQNTQANQIALIKSGLVDAYRTICQHDLSPKTIQKHEQTIKKINFPIKVKVLTLGLLIRQLAIHKPVRGPQPEEEPV